MSVAGEFSAEPYCLWRCFMNHGSIFSCHRDGDVSGILRGHRCQIYIQIIILPVAPPRPPLPPQQSFM